MPGSPVRIIFATIENGVVDKIVNSKDQIRHSVRVIRRSGGEISTMDLNALRSRVAWLIHASHYGRNQTEFNKI